MEPPVKLFPLVVAHGPIRSHELERAERFEIHGHTHILIVQSTIRADGFLVLCGGLVTFENSRLLQEAPRK